MRALPATFAALALSACSNGADGGSRFVERGLALTLPEQWSSTGFSQTVTPHRLVAASYAVHPSDVEGDCGGLAAVERLPSDGAYVVLIDYGPGSAGSVDADDFADERPASGRDDPFAATRLGEFGCFGRSYLFRFLLEGRALQAHLGVGARAGERVRGDAVAVLESVKLDEK